MSFRTVELLQRRSEFAGVRPSCLPRPRLLLSRTVRPQPPFEISPCAPPVVLPLPTSSSAGLRSTIGRESRAAASDRPSTGARRNLLLVCDSVAPHVAGPQLLSWDRPRAEVRRNTTDSNQSTGTVGHRLLGNIQMTKTFHLLGLDSAILRFWQEPTVP